MLWYFIVIVLILVVLMVYEMQSTALYLITGGGTPNIRDKSMMKTDFIKLIFNFYDRITLTFINQFF